MSGSAGRVLIWDFDGTLAFRPGNWTGTLCEVVTADQPGLAVTLDHLRPHLQSGFPWHTPDVVRTPCSADQWWDALSPVFETAFRLGAGLEEADAQRLASRVRARYTDPEHWQVFDDVRPVLGQLRDRGWRHIVLSNHVPELPELVTALGLRDVFAAVYSSGLTGTEKPHAKAFETVFADHPEARRGWMIGDSWRADVQGARAVGLRAILVRERHPEASAHGDSLHDVLRIVEGS